MLRLQSSWLLEAAAEHAGVDSLFFPYFHRFSALNWLSRKEITLYLNSPVDSQAMLARAWINCRDGGFGERNLQKFNQVIKKPLELDLNPFRTWKDRFFGSQQLDYLFYWREAAYEIEDEKQREIFWSVVYQIISYWVANQKAGTRIIYEPDQIMAYYLNQHQRFVRGRSGRVEISCIPLEELAAGKNPLIVFPLLFEDEENSETELQIIYHAWFHGYADLEQSRRDLRNILRHYLISFEKSSDWSLFVRLAAGADSAALTWSGRDLPPKIYEQELIGPMRQAFSAAYKSSRLTYKAVDRTCDAYDYLLMFHN
ncbi:MAG TPA: hypothetical protein PLM07_05725 [Candidatus Rifleibacterium sp.]|nr:hypothetical protein [Candidatus Rifleibacterium sp.]HPT45382.1 hypothetical protein [Candidatus Rifleibacterium sp.]